DVAIEVELQRDGGVAERAGGRHFGDAGNASELAFERRRHGGGHGFGTGAGKRRADLEGGEIDLRQGRDREELVAQRSGQRDRRREQRRADRTVDEGGGEAHGAPSRAASTPAAADQPG